MKETVFIIMVGLLLPPLGGAQEEKEAKPDFLKNLQTVEKIEPLPPRLATGFDSIGAKEMMAMLAFLSSDNLEGREIGSRGYDTAAEYAQSLFALWGLEPGGDTVKTAPASRRRMEPAQKVAPARRFLQEFELKEALESTATISLQTVRPGNARRTLTFSQGVDFIFSSNQPIEISAPIVFAGYGISEKGAAYNDLARVDVKDKIVMILSEAPGKEDSASPFQKKELKDKYFPAMPSRRGGLDFTKSAEILKRGALAVLMIRNSPAEFGDIQREIIAQKQIRDDKPILPDARKRLVLPGGKTLPMDGRNIVKISRDMANAILATANETVDSLKKKIVAKYKPHSIALPGASLQISNVVRFQLIKSANVVAFIEGSDPQLKGQALVIGGHLDHLGRHGDYIYNGAEDNGSGVCGVLAVARALALNPQKPKRSVVFCLWTGEEQGLLGSRYYTEHPLISLDNTMAYINLDMIALPWSEEGLRQMMRMMNMGESEALLKKIKPENFLPVFHSNTAPDLKTALLEANRYSGFDILYRESPKTLEMMMGGSDHASFAMAGNPWIGFIGGMGNDYHTPADSLEKFNGETMAKISRLVYVTAFLLADK